MTNNDRDHVKATANLEWHDITVRTSKTAYLTLKQAKKLHRKLGKAIRALEAS